MGMVRNALAATVLAGALFCVSPARAAFIVDFAQVGSNVVATGSGSFDLTGLTNYNYSAWTNTGTLSLGSGGYVTIGSGSDYSWHGFTGPASFGTAEPADGAASSNTGPMVGISPGFPAIYLPTTYASGASLSDSSTWNGTTLASLGLTPGSSVWTWGSGANADSLTFVVDPVPEPASIALLATGLAGLGMTIRRRRKAS